MDFLTNLKLFVIEYSFGIILFTACLLIIIAVGIHRRRDRYRQCTSKTAGLIVNITGDKYAYGDTVKIKYCIGDRKYFISEKIRFKHADNGQRVPVMGHLHRGDQLTIYFNPKKHRDAYAAENHGIFSDKK